MSNNTKPSMAFRSITEDASRSPPLRKGTSAAEPESEISELDDDGVAMARNNSDMVPAGDVGGKTAKWQPENSDPSAAIIAAAIHAATTPTSRQRLFGSKAIAVLVNVPSPDWVRAVDSYFMTFDTMRWATFARDGSNRSRDKGTVGNDEVSHLLSSGRRVIGIAHSAETMLPSSLLTAADLTITIGTPTGAIVRDAMRRCLRGSLPGTIGDAVVANLEFDDIISALRLGSTPKQALKRLKAASLRCKSKLQVGPAPRLETAVEFGAAAQEWGLALARDIGDYRAGRLPWSQCDRGAVFHSAPGCGKSLLAASIAQACDVPLIRVSVAEYFSDNSGDLGGVVKAQRAIFARAAASAPCILFLDEIDAVPNRATMSPRGRDWWLPVINDLLLLLDAAIGGQREGVVVLGATNRIEDVDVALLRPGRLERCIEITRPDLAGTKNVLRYHLAESLIDKDITDVAQMLEGSTPAEIMDVVRSARRVARHARRDLTIGDLQNEARGSANEAPEYLRRISIHEAAHAVTAVAIPIGTVRVVRLTSRGVSAGHTLVKYSDDDLMTLEDIEDRVTSILSAAVAEKLILGAASTGSGGDDKCDLGVATAMLAVVHTSTGMSGTLFHRCSVDDALATARADPALRRKIERHLRMLEQRAEELVWRHRTAILAVAEELEAKRHLTGDEVAAILEREYASTREADRWGG